MDLLLIPRLAQSFWSFIEPLVSDEIKMQLDALRSSDSAVKRCRVSVCVCVCVCVHMSVCLCVCVQVLVFAYLCML